MGEAQITEFLSALATNERVRASTQHQALSALLFLDTEVLGRDRAWLVAALLYGSGLRLRECGRRRVTDVDLVRHDLTVRDIRPTGGPVPGAWNCRTPCA